MVRQDAEAAIARSKWPILVTGFGLGAILDGIILHQVLQWHHLVSGYRTADALAALEYNTFWDGIFHLVSWAIVFGGLLWLVQSRSDLREVGLRLYVGWTLMGWGAFNIVDQVVFHMLLGAHHIRMVDNYQMYDWGYTALGCLIDSHRSGDHTEPAPPEGPHEVSAALCDMDTEASLTASPLGRRSFRTDAAALRPRCQQGQRAPADQHSRPRVVYP
ncbi:MAG TPA: DUF2243 domain-containing protein [Dermatophilaceae bacterium]|nr:DUF2243 domain-containing protein [Dermatophilaceae bacterium]